MIESIFWQAEIVHELDQGLWDDVTCYGYIKEYCYSEEDSIEEMITRWHPIGFDEINLIYTSNYFPKIVFGLKEHD